MNNYLSYIKIAIAVSVLSVITLLSGCRKELCYDHYRYLTLQSDWEFVWERDYGCGWQETWDTEAMARRYEDFLPGMPEGITMLLYDEEEEPSKSFLKPEGGDIVLNEGSHSILLYNNDTRYIVLNDMATAPTARASSTTRTRASLPELHEGERSVAPPDVLFAAYSGNVPEVDLHNRVELPMKLTPLVYTYYIRFNIVEGLSNISLVRGALAGMADSVYLLTGATSEEAATILFDCTLTPFGAETDMRSFGVPGFPDNYYGREAGNENRRYTLNLEILLKNGKTVSFDYDVTPQLANQPRGGVIVIDGIELGEEMTGNNSGFDVGVSDWGEWTDIDIPVGPSN